VIGPFTPARATGLSNAVVVVAGTVDGGAVVDAGAALVAGGAPSSVDDESEEHDAPTSIAARNRDRATAAGRPRETFGTVP
jgi:hypothetical protein